MLEKIILRNKKSDSWRIFTSPEDVLFTHDISRVRALLADIEGQVEKNNLFAVGYLSYEAAPAFDSSYVVQNNSILPLMCFGLFTDYEEYDLIKANGNSFAALSNWELGVSADVYKENFLHIKEQIALGNTYQINYTIRNHTKKLMNPYKFFIERAMHAPYAAYIEVQDHTIISASPELFFSLNDEDLICRPMKGTSKRGKTLVEDNILGNELKNSEKNIAENIMITDMLRNDMGRISESGSINVSSLCDVEKYPTVWQMTSTIESKTSASIVEIFKALFPCASVTGAPKISSMEIISKIEDKPREIYTGAIGIIEPNRQASFSVPIRTIILNNKTKVATYGTGGGIVWDSDYQEELQECITKSAVLTTTNINNDFELFETMLWAPGQGILLEDFHLERLFNSAVYFGFSFDETNIKSQLGKYIEELRGKSKIIRLFLNQNADINISQEDFINTEKEYTVSLANNPVDSEDVFLYHKTTKRDVYENACGEEPISNDVLLWNTEGNITETTIANVIIMIDNEFVTPPIQSGLLGGTYRAMLLEKGKIIERVIHKSELAALKEITLINSVRGKFQAQLI